MVAFFLSVIIVQISAGILVKPDKVLDCVGLYCPEPIFRARNTLDNMGSGEVLKVISDDPSSENEFKWFVDRFNHRLISLHVVDGQIITLIQKR